MGEIDKRGKYLNQIPFEDTPYVSGVVSISSNNKALNDYLERNIRLLLRDIYYGRVEDFEL